MSSRSSPRGGRPRSALPPPSAVECAFARSSVEQIGEQAMDAFNEPEYEECFAPLEEMREWDWEWNT